MFWKWQITRMEKTLSEYQIDLMIDFLISLLELEEPIPLDFHMKLVAEGIDVDFYIRKYTI